MNGLIAALLYSSCRPICGLSIVSKEDTLEHECSKRRKGGEKNRVCTSTAYNEEEPAIERRRFTIHSNSKTGTAMSKLISTIATRL